MYIESLNRAAHVCKARSEFFHCILVKTIFFFEFFLGTHVWTETLQKVNIDENNCYTMCNTINCKDYCQVIEYDRYMYKSRRQDNI